MLLYSWVLPLITTKLDSNIAISEDSSSGDGFCGDGRGLDDRAASLESCDLAPQNQTLVASLAKGWGVKQKQICS